MIASYPLDNIPTNIPPFQSLAGLDDCWYGLEDVFVNYLYNGYQEKQMTDMPNNYILSDYQIRGAIILKQSMTDKEYIEYLYSLRDFSWSFDISYFGSYGNQGDPNYFEGSFDITLDYTSYPILAESGVTPTYATAKYLAPPARCFLNNRINNLQVNKFQYAYRNVTSYSGADELKRTRQSGDISQNKTIILFDESTLGEYLFFKRVNIWQREYYDSNGSRFFFSDAVTDAEKEPFGYLGTGLLLRMPHFDISVPYYDDGAQRYYHSLYRCSFATYFDDPTYSIGRNAPFTFSFGGNEYDSYFNVLDSLADTNTTTATITTADTYFNFLDS